MKTMGMGQIQDSDPTYDDIQIIRGVQCATIKRALREPIEPVKMEEGDRGIMKGDSYISNLLRASWPYFITNDDGSYNEPLNTIDCLVINQKAKKLKLGNEKDPIVHLPLINFQVNLEDMTAVKD